MIKQKEKRKKKKMRVKHFIGTCGLTTSIIFCLCGFICITLCEKTEMIPPSKTNI
jgi:hypothetical protein